MFINLTVRTSNGQNNVVDMDALVQKVMDGFHSFWYLSGCQNNLDECIEAIQEDGKLCAECKELFGDIEHIALAHFMNEAFDEAEVERLIAVGKADNSRENLF